MTLHSTEQQHDDWCTLPSDEVVQRLAVNASTGLSHAEVADRRALHGSNRLTEPPRRSKWLVFIDQFRAGIVYVLAGAGLIAGLLGDIKDLVIIAK